MDWDDDVDPPEIVDAAEEAEEEYQKLQEWMLLRKAKRVSETVLLAYYHEQVRLIPLARFLFVFNQIYCIIIIFILMNNQI